MTALETMREWLKTFPGYESLSGFYVDYTDQVPANGGLFPAGLVEVSRRKSICGEVTVENQYNFALYTVFEKAPGDDAGASVNADWVLALQEWVQEQSAAGQAPVFGDVPRAERITAQNGAMYETDDEGTAMYMVQLCVQFTKKYEVKNKWLI